MPSAMAAGASEPAVDHHFDAQARMKKGPGALGLGFKV